MVLGTMFAPLPAHATGDGEEEPSDVDPEEDQPSDVDPEQEEPSDVDPLEAGPLQERASPILDPNALPEILPKPAPPTDIRDAIARAEPKLDAADHRGIVELLSPWLNDAAELESLINSGELKRETWHQAERLMGWALYFEQDYDEAARHFLMALRLSPNYDFVPLWTPNEIIAYYNGLRLSHAEDLDSYPRPLLETLYPDRPRRRDLAQARGVASIPFVGPFSNGNRIRGSLYIGVGGAALAGSAITWLVLYRWDQAPPPKSEWQKVQATNIVMVSILATAAIISSIDGRATFERRLKGKQTTISLDVQGAGLRLRF